MKCFKSESTATTDMGHIKMCVLHKYANYNINMLL
jgi:hypothetical protein